MADRAGRWAPVGLLYFRAVLQDGEGRCPTFRSVARGRRSLKVFAVLVAAVVVGRDRLGAAWLPHFDAARDDQLVATGLDLIRHG